MLEPRSRAAFERFMERARSSRSGSWGVSLRPEDAMSGEKGVWGEHQARFLAALQELLTESRLSVFGMADVHLTAADFIDTAQEYIEFFKASRVETRETTLKCLTFHYFFFNIESSGSLG